jgi:alanyl-tRNA synthetase
LRVAPHEVPDSIERLQAKVKELQEELDAARARQAAGEAKALAAQAQGGVLVVRRDGSTPDDLRRLALVVRDEMHSGVVVLVGLSPEGSKAGLAVAVSSDLVGKGVSAAEVAGEAARTLGGGTARNPDLVTGGGPRVENIEAALEQARIKAIEAVSGAGGGG